MGYDELISKVHGEPYDRKLFFVCFLNGFPNALLLSSIVMVMYAPPDQRCNLPNYLSEIEFQNSSFANETNDFFLPRDAENKNMTSKCLKYNRTKEEFIEFWNETEDRKSNWYNGSLSNSTISCRNDKMYFETYGKTSLIMEFDLTCCNSWLKPLISSLFMAGFTIGSALGFIADRFGRKPVFCVFKLLVSGLTFFIGCTSSIPIFLILFTLSGMSSVISYMTGFVLGTECTIPSRRNFLSISSFITYSCSYAVASLLGYLTPDWRWLLRIIGLCGIVFISNLWLVPESPRWLMANGKVEEAKKVLAMIAKYNGKEHVIKELDEAVEEEAKTLVDTKTDKETSQKKSKMCSDLLQVFMNPRMLVFFIITSISWLCSTVLYYGISLSVQALSGNLYINNTVMGLVEFPGLLLAYLSVKYFSRPLCHGGLTVVSGLFCLTAALLSDISPALATIGGLTGKCLNAGAFYLVFIHTAEIFPTLIRSSIMGVGSTSGRIGAILSPYLAYLGDLYGMYVPYLILSIMGLIVGISVLLGLPETKDKELPESVEDTLGLKTILENGWMNCRRKKAIDASEQPSTDENAVSLL